MRDIARQVVSAAGQADEAQKVHRDGPKLSTFAPSAWQPQGDLDNAGALTRVGAEQDVVEHRHAAEQFGRLKCPANAQPRNHMRFASEKRELAKQNKPRV